MALQIQVLSLFPELVQAVTEYGITGRAISRGLLSVAALNPRDYTVDVHRNVDDRVYGGGPGMVMKYQPLEATLHAAKQRTPMAKTVYMSPQGQPLSHPELLGMSQGDDLILIAGRYEGIDERFVEQHVDAECSIGDYVLSGGELPAMVLIDAIARLLPGALGDEDSAAQDSFADGLLDCPHYTRPEVIGEQAVPPVLLSGDHAAIARWRRQQALGRTWLRRPDLLTQIELSKADEALLEQFKHLSKPKN